VTDGVNWKHAVFSFQTEPLMLFDPFDEGWSYRKNITIDASKIAGNLDDFPVLISIIDADVEDKSQLDADDLLFMDGEGVAQRLWHEIEHYDASSGELVCWVHVPQLNPNGENRFYMYYGNPSVDSQQFPEQVWNDAYMAVWHLQDNPMEMVRDSTRNDNDGTAHGGMSTSNVDLGKIGFALQFDGVDDYINIADSTSLKPQDVTVSVWYKPITFGDGGYFVSKCSFDYWGNSDGHTYGFTPNIVSARFEKNTNQQQDTVGEYTPILNEWHYLTLSYEEASATGMLYSNAVLNGAVSPCHSSVLWYNKPWDFLIGGSKQGTGSGKLPTNFINCALDEIRVSNTARSNEWVLTEYYNQNDPASFYIIGPEETEP
jgi:hypothetical protein